MITTRATRVGLVRETLPAAAVVERIAREAEAIIAGRLAAMIAR